ncbi:MAG: hypothetical protein RLZZ200_2323 [Pseudomonadota bacterium]|jgi:pimeloyl-ACP methyl ester carboxylesterase
MVSRHDVSPYDWMVWPEGALESALAQGTRRRDVMAYLGEHDFATLAPLARAAAHAHRDPERVVHVVPGFLGSQLGIRRSGNQPPDLLWIDPQDFHLGGLADLSLQAGLPIVSLGAMPYTYLALKLRLEIAGFTVRWADYDWRRGVEECGAQLASRIAAEPARRQYIVGHSLGGLVARAALAATDAMVERVVTLGTPHRGSFAAVQALRGSYFIVRHIAQLDPSRSAEDLAREVFASFPSLHQMVPGAVPHLPWPEGRMHCIAGVGADTVTHATQEGMQFRYDVSRDGDGTVMRSSAVPVAGKAHYCRTLHAVLPRDPAVADAVIDLLDRGATQALPDAPPAVTDAARSITDAEMQADCRDKLDWSSLSPTARRDWFARMNQPIAAGSPLVVQP